MSRLIGEAPEPEALRLLRERGGRWFAYQNQDLGHPEVGHLVFLKCGPGCTFETPPERCPDYPEHIMWRYVLVGEVNLETGEIGSL